VEAVCIIGRVAGLGRRMISGSFLSHRAWTRAIGGGFGGRSPPELINAHHAHDILQAGLSYMSFKASLQICVDLLGFQVCSDPLCIQAGSFMPISPLVGVGIAKSTQITFWV
jgi:hypothetical protein